MSKKVVTVKSGSEVTVSVEGVIALDFCKAGSAKN